MTDHSPPKPKDADAESETPAPGDAFRRFLSKRDLPGLDGRRIDHAATEAECAAIAESFGLSAVRDLHVEATIAREGVEGWRLDGRLTAAITQSCVVTLEPVEAVIDEPFTRSFVPGDAAAEEAFAGEIDIDPDAEDPPEPLGAGVDIGAVALETLALAIDPYPRAPGAVFTGAGAAPPGAEPIAAEALKPFAGLAALKRRLKE